MKVHLLITYRREELLPASLMVFKTIRKAFPNAEIEAQINIASDADPKLDSEPIWQAAAEVGIWMGAEDIKTIHHAWILERLENSDEPFWICDTDIQFHGLVEDWDFGDAPIAGRFIPRFFDKFTNCITQPRLHTSLMRFNPERIREEAERYFAQFPKTPFNHRPNMIYPMFHPVREGITVKNYFYDTCSMLYHAIGGACFQSSQLELYDHLNFGTISDVVAPHYPNHPIRASHFLAFDQPETMRGSWRRDEEFYQAHAVT